VDIEQAKKEIRSAYEQRAAMYYHIFVELREEVGQDRAVAIMRAAIYRRGVETGEKYHAAAARGDFEEIGRIFCAGSAAGGELFEPSVAEVGEKGAVLKMTACPLLDSWRKLGVAPEELDLMCAIAAAVDEGTYEGAGLAFSFRERLGQPGATACLLDIRKR